MKTAKPTKTLETWLNDPDVIKTLYRSPSISLLVKENFGDIDPDEADPDEFILDTTKEMNFDD